MKWIKASERLPETQGDYLCKYDSANRCLEFDGIAFLFSYKNGLPDSKIEWLDETPESQSSSSSPQEFELVVRRQVHDIVNGLTHPWTAVDEILKAYASVKSPEPEKEIVVTEEISELCKAARDFIDGELTCQAFEEKIGEVESLLQSIPSNIEKEDEKART